MTVIVGVKTENTVIIAADKRATNIITRQVSDDLDKVIQINDKLCIGIAGNKAIASVIKMEIDKVFAKTEMVIEDVIEIIQNYYRLLVDTNSKITMSHIASFMIGGLKKNGNTGLYEVYNYNGQLNVSEINDFAKIIPPDGMSVGEANNIFLSNLSQQRRDYIEKTIMDISSVNEYVSPTGDKWNYDKRSNCSEKTSF